MFMPVAGPVAALAVPAAGGGAAAAVAAAAGAAAPSAGPAGCPFKCTRLFNDKSALPTPNSGQGASIEMQRIPKRYLLVLGHRRLAECCRLTRRGLSLQSSLSAPNKTASCGREGLPLRLHAVAAQLVAAAHVQRFQLPFSKSSKVIAINCAGVVIPSSLNFGIE